MAFLAAHRFSIFLKWIGRLHGWRYRCHLFRKVGQMLKITHDGTAAETRWTLCGKLSGPWVGELRAEWDRVLSRFQGASHVVDLSNVVSIDESGENLLRAMKHDGAKFVARGVDMKHILSHLRSRGKPSLRRSLAHLDRGRNCSE